jgi:short-subunit dehydrogenase
VITADLSTEGGARAVLDATGDLDVGLLVSNAGDGHPGRFLDQALDDLHRRLTLNATAHLDLAYGFGRRLMARGRGGIILVSALGAIHGLPNMAHESASKAYVLNLGEALHYELAPAGIEVMVMLPGNVDTPIIEHFGLDRADLPIRPMPAAEAVAETVAAFLRGRPMHIPGRLMRVTTRLMPRKRSVRLNGRLLGRAAAKLTRRESAVA